MLDIAKWGMTSATVTRLSPASRQLVLPTGVGGQFIPAAGTHYNLTLRRGNRREVVDVTGGTGDTLFIARGMDHTVPMEWPAGTCVSVEWNPEQLCEFVHDCTGAAQPGIIAPGVYCLDCATCITVDAAGRITNIDGAEKC